MTADSLEMQRSESYYIIKWIKTVLDAPNNPRIELHTDVYWTGMRWSHDRLRAQLFTDIEDAHNNLKRIPVPIGSIKLTLLNILLTEWAEA